MISLPTTAPATYDNRDFQLAQIPRSIFITGEVLGLVHLARAALELRHFQTALNGLNYNNGQPPLIQGGQDISDFAAVAQGSLKTQAFETRTSATFDAYVYAGGKADLRTITLKPGEILMIAPLKNPKTDGDVAFVIFNKNESAINHKPAVAVGIVNTRPQI